MNDLRRYFENNSGNLIDKWAHYFDVYDRFFSRYRGTDVHLLEIGVYHGGSLQMWKNYFGDKARLFGVDMHPYCKQFEDEQTQILIGDQADKDFLHRLRDQVPRIDIVIDDGGHTMTQQINSFEVLYPHVSPTGLYVCEDLHTSYWRIYGGGYRRRGTFIEHSKNLIDFLHAWHSENPSQFKVSDFTTSTYALHYYDSILVIEKSPISKPYRKTTGVRALPVEPPEPTYPFWEKTWLTAKGALKRLLMQPPNSRKT